MPYYPEFNLLHLHCPKTGGTSLENTLMQALGKPFFNYARSRERYSAGDLTWQQRNWYGYEKVDGTEFALQHMTLQQMVQWKYVQNHLADPDLTIVMIVRNPYSRIVSEYKWQTLFGYKGSFETFVCQAHREKWHESRTFMQHLVPQTQFVAGVSLDDPRLHIIYFEHMSLAIQNLFEQLGKRHRQLYGIKSMRTDNVTAHISKRHATTEKPWKAYFADQATADKVLEMYAADFETFGYATEVKSAE